MRAGEIETGNEGMMDFSDKRAGIERDGDITVERLLGDDEVACYAAGDRSILPPAYPLQQRAADVFGVQSDPAP